MKYYSHNEKNFGGKGNVVTYYKVNYKTGFGQYLSIVFPFEDEEKPFYVVKIYKIGNEGYRNEITKREYYRIIRFIVLSDLARKPSFWAPPSEPY